MLHNNNRQTSRQHSGRLIFNEMMMDKVVLVLAFVLFMMSDQFQGKPLTPEEIKNITAECLSETNFDRATLDKAIRRQKLPSYDSKYAKHLLCTYKKQGYVDDEGNIEFDRIEEFLTNFYEKSDVVNVRAACQREVKGETQEERAYSAAKCLIDTLHQLEKEQAKKVKS